VYTHIVPTAPAPWSQTLSHPSSVPTESFRPQPRELSPDLKADRLAWLLKTALERISAPLARAAAVLVEQEAWTAFGHARLVDHARERFGRSSRWVRDLAALGRGLDTLPGLERALSGIDGEPSVGFVAALHIARIASPDSVPAWVDLARTTSIRQFKDQIRHAREANSSSPVETSDRGQPATDGGTPPGEGDSLHKHDHANPGGAGTGPDNGNSSHIDDQASPRGEGAGLDDGNSSLANGNSSPGDANNSPLAKAPDPDRWNSIPGNNDPPQRDGLSSPGREAKGHQTENTGVGGETAAPQAGHIGSGGEMTGERLRVRLLTPRPVRVAFEEGLELCRAVEGHDVPVSDYVDALVAEASTGESPADADCLPVLHGKTQAEMEEALEQATGNWRELEIAPPVGQETERENPETARMAALLQRFIQGSSGSGANPPNVFHAAIESLIVPTGDSPGGNGNPPNVLHAAIENLIGPTGDSPGGNGNPPNVFHATIENLIGPTDGSSAGNGSPPNVFYAAIENPDTMIRQLLVLQDRCERQLGRLLARMSDQGTWRRLCFAGLGHYAEQRLGLARTSARDRARLARGLRTLPVVRRAYDDGRLGSVAALCLVRMLENEPPDEAVQREWVERAARGTVKRLRDEHRDLDRRQVNERSPRSFRQASERSPRGRRPLTDAEWHRSLYREPGTARARVEQLGREATVLSFANTIFSVSLPEELAAAFLSSIELARKDLQDKARAAGEMFEGPGGNSRWDHRVLALRTDRRTPAGDEEPDEQASALCLDQLITSGKGEPDNRARALCIDRPTPSSNGEPGEEEWGNGKLGKEAPGDDEGARASLVIARKLVAHGHEVPAWVGLLALIEEFVATWDVAQNPRRPSEDAVHIRDGWRCMAPGCTSRRNLQEHHVRYRSQGGGDEMGNRLCLCAFHHQRGEHGELASCRGLAPLGIEWSLGRGGRGGLFRNEIRKGALS